MRLLLAEDNRELAHWLEKALVQGGFAVDCVFDGRAADHLLQSEKYALAVLDIGMPGLDGLEVVQRLRKRGQTLPVLLLTARSAVADRVKGLNVGADDYFAQKTPLKPHKETLMNIAHFLEERGRKEGVLQGMKAGIEKGLRKGRQEGRNEGRHQGQQEATQRIAQAMLDDGLEPSQVAKLTGLSLRQLAKLRH